MRNSILKYFLFYLGTLSFLSTVSSQDLTFVNRDTVYVDHIKTVELLDPNINPNDSFFMPTINLKGQSFLKLSFDDFLDDIEDYFVIIRHCNYDWTPSDLSPLEYNDGFDEDLITDYDFSETFYSVYNHYNYVFPNNNMSPSKTGNYLLHVYRYRDTKTPVLTRRFYVYDPQLFVEPNYQFPKRYGINDDVQEIDFRIRLSLTSRTGLSNPMTNLKVDIYQNGRSDNAIKGIKANFMGINEIRFKYLDKIVFPATREYRFFDTRSTRVASTGVEKIIESEDKLIAILNLDESRERGSYFYIKDINGGFVIDSYNKQGNPEVTAEYCNVIFSYKSIYEKYGKEVHLYGKFTDWRLDDKSKMEYSYKYKCYYKELLLKQGYYNYAYSIVDKGVKISDLQQAEGNKFEAENTYFYFVYYRSPIGRYDQLLGYLPHKKIHYE